MRAIKLIRATLAAALFAGAALTAACAVEDEAVVDDEAVLDDVAADVKGEVLADKAGSVTSYCDGRVTVWTSRSTVTANHYKGSSRTGPWQFIGRGIEVTVRETAARRFFKIGTQVIQHNSACNSPGNPGEPQDPR